MLCSAGALAFTFTACGDAASEANIEAAVDGIADDLLDNLETEVETEVEAPDTASTDGSGGKVPPVCTDACVDGVCVTKCGEEGHECGEACHGHAEGEEHEHAEGEEHTH